MLLSHVALCWVPQKVLSKDPAIQKHQYKTANITGAFILMSVATPTRRLPFVPERVQILDIVGEQCPPPQLLRLFTQLHTTRRASHPGQKIESLPSPATVIDYVDYGGPLAMQNWAYIPPRGTTERIVHLRHSSPWTWAGNSDSRGPPEPYPFAGVNTLVVWPLPASDMSFTDVFTALMFLVLRPMSIEWDGRAPISLTVVGVEKLFPARTPLRTAHQFWTEVGNRFSASSARRMLIRATLELCTRFLTHDEWLHELGDWKDVVAEWVWHGEQRPGREEMQY